MKNIRSYGNFINEEMSPDTINWIKVGLSIIADILLIIGWMKYHNRIMNWTTIGLRNLVQYGLHKTDFMKELNGGKYSNFEIEDSYDEIIIKKDPTIVKIDKKTKNMSFTSNFGNFNKKLDDNQYNKILNLVSKYKTNLDQINDIYQEIKDEFKYNIDFKFEKKLMIKLTKNGNSTNLPKMYYKTEKINEFVSLVEESIDRIEDTFNVKLNNDVVNNKLNYFIFKKDDDLYVNDKGSDYSISLLKLGYLPSYLNLIFDKK